MENKTSQPRARKTGLYTFRNFDAICANCGQTLGVHDAEAPHRADDLCIAERRCDGFKKVRAPKAACGACSHSHPGTDCPQPFGT